MLCSLEQKSCSTMSITTESISNRTPVSPVWQKKINIRLEKPWSSSGIGVRVLSATLGLAAPCKGHTHQWSCSGTAFKEAIQTGGGRPGAREAQNTILL